MPKIVIATTATTNITRYDISILTMKFIGIVASSYGARVSELKLNKSHYNRTDSYNQGNIKGKAKYF